MFISAGAYSGVRFRRADAVGVRRFIGMIPSFLFCIQSDGGAQIDHVVVYVLCMFTLITMDTDTLISKVFLRSAIWDKRLKIYTNRAVVDNCWREISGEMEVPGK